MPRRIIVTGVTQASRAMRLKTFLESQKEHFDEWHMWINTRDATQVPAVTQPWIKIINPGDADPADSLSRFMPGYCDTDTAYARLDENIAWMDPSFVKTLFEYREAAASHFLVHANVVNSSPLAHVHERLGCVSSKAGRATFVMDDPVAKSDDYSADVVSSFKDSVAHGSTEAWTFGRWMLYHEHVDLHAFAWLGCHFDVFGGRVAMEETPFLCSDHPRRYGMPSSVCGKALCIWSHEDIIARSEPEPTPEPAPTPEPEPEPAPTPEPAPASAEFVETTPPPADPPADPPAGPPAAPRKRRATRRVVVS